MPRGNGIAAARATFNAGAEHLRVGNETSRMVFGMARTVIETSRMVIGMTRTVADTSRTVLCTPRTEVGMTWPFAEYSVGFLDG